MGRFDDWYWYTGRTVDRGYVPPTRSRLGWEKEVVSTGKSYSSVFWKPSVNKDKGLLITRAYNLAKDMILVMDTPTKVTIKILNDSCNELAYTDGKVVFVSTSVFDKGIPEEEAVDIFCGLTIHEGCHLLYSEMGKYKNWISKHIKEKSPNLEIRKHICNIIEDERVEQELGLNKPGLMVFLEKMKKSLFEESRKTAPKETDAFNQIEKLIDVLFQVIRYPKFLNEEDLDINFDFFSKVQEVIVPLPSSTEETTKAADKIYDLLIEAIGDKDKSQTVTNLDMLSDHSKFKKRVESMITDFLVGIDADIRTSDEFTGSETDRDGFIKKRTKDVSEALRTNKGVLGKVLEGRYEQSSSDKKTIFVKETPGSGGASEKSRYISDREKIKKYIPSIKKILTSNNKDYTGVLHGCKTGTLDTTKLAEAYQGVDHVYFRNYQVKTNKTSVCVVIDESGSMCGERERSARRAAILLNEAFKSIPGINLYIYGHSADELRLYSEKSTDIYVYKEPGLHNQYALGSSQARYENRDGVALRQIAQRVRKFDQNEVLMFILSDGCPSAVDYRGGMAIEDTKKAVQEIEKMGFIPIQISISSSHSPKSMFKNYAKITDLSNLAQELGKLVKKAVLKATKTDITL